MRALLSPLFALPFLLTGCALSAPSSGVALHGQLHGGQQAVAGAKVYLLAANTTGYGQPSVSLLLAADTGNAADAIGSYVKTDANGFWSITGDYNACASSTTQVYLYGLGGNAGGGANSDAGFLAALGNCGGLSTVGYVWMDEVTTVAAAYAIAGFATDATHVSSSGTALALTGIQNAFKTSSNLVSLSTGMAYSTTPAGNAAVPSATIYTLANILSSCVNSAGPGAGSNCNELFAASKSGGTSGNLPTDTATAAINIAHYPGSSTSTLWSLVPATPPFAGGLMTQPNDFTLALNYTGGGISKPESIAVDGSDNVWVANYGTAGVSKILASGAFATSSPFTAGGIGLSDAIAIDGSGNAWIANSNNSLSELTSTGSAVSASAYTGAGLNAPSSIAIDANGYVWVGDSAKSYCVSEFYPNGNAVAGYTSSTDAACSGVYSIAIDKTGDVLAVSNDNSALIEMYGSVGPPLVPGMEIGKHGGGGIASPDGVAINNSGDIWTANGAKNSTTLSEFGTNAVAISGTNGVIGGGLQTPSAIASDGGGNLWIANSGGPSVSEFTSLGVALSPAASGSFNGGYTGGNLSNPAAIAVDGSGNVWVADEGSSTVVELIGIGTPVVTPLVASITSPYNVPGSEP
jgi:sugar lactone lactonase YvrE